MKKLLTPSDWLLIGFSKFNDVYGDMRNLYRPQYRRHNLSQLVYHNIKTKNIRKIIKDGKAYFELTGQGKDKIRRKYPLLYLQNTPWDKKWRIVIYDIEEKSKTVRDHLRRKLIELGFAQLQRSVWVSPHDFLQDIHEFLEFNSLLNAVILIETANFFVEDIKELANKLWQLDKLNEKYKQIYEAWKYQKKMRDRIANSDSKTVNIDIREKFIEVMLLDPFLPEEFLPEDWYGEKTRELFK